MPLFRYSLTYAGETRSTDLRKSNPQGWLLEAVRAVYPEFAAQKADEIIRLKLGKTEDGNEIWQAVLPDSSNKLVIRVTKLRS